MKVFYLSNNKFPGSIASSLQTVKMCEAFSYLKHEVTLVCPGTNKSQENIFKYYDVQNRFNIKVLKKYKKFPLGIKYYLFSISSILLSLKNKPDIFITRNFFTSFLLVMLKKKHILELHHDVEIESRIVQFLIKRTRYLNSNKIIKLVAITESIKKHFQTNYDIKEKKILVSPSGSSLKTNFSFNRNRKLKIGYFGSIYKSRGAETFINLSKIDRDNDYYLFGNLNQYKNLKNNIDNLHLKGYIPYKDISTYLTKMDVLLMPYLSKATATGDVGNIIKFTSPLKLFDYLASGKIIIASNIEVLKEVINKNNAIFINNFENIYSWKNEINKIKNNTVKRFIISKNNYKLSKKFTLNERAKIILDGV